MTPKAEIAKNAVIAAFKGQEVYVRNAGPYSAVALIIGHGWTHEEAWIDAASRLPAPPVAPPEKEVKK